LYMTKESVLNKLKEGGLKATPQRLAVIDALIESGSLHPGATLVFREARRRIATLSLSTVYAILKELSRIGIVKTLQFDKMENRYDNNTANHINVICERCKKIVDYKVPFAIDEEAVKKETGFAITDVRFEYYGICPECRSKIVSEGGG
jgi:Fur family transcriptional regulator, peroxide stress response regulator